MKMAKPGIVEREIAGVIEGIALSHGGPVSFPVILSINGQTLHNHYHGNTLEKGRMLVIDAGCESELHYASDITRTFPVEGKFSQRQQEIYEVVLNANMASIKAVKPDSFFRDIHLLAAAEITKGLINLGLMKGDPKEAVEKRSIYTLLPAWPWAIRWDWMSHDLEGVGENFVGYDQEISRR